nr:hypothetical protein [Halomicronema hongdechloris]
MALTKPIIVIKAGRTEAAAQAAASHTGSLAGSDAVLRCRLSPLRRRPAGEHGSRSCLTWRKCWGKQNPLPQGPRLTIITNGRRPWGLSPPTP